MFSEIIRDTAELVRRTAHPKRNTIQVSPELAEFFARAGASAAPATESAPNDDGRVARLAEIAREVAACTKCGLCTQRTQTVFSDGNPYARVVFVGEAPGADEDAQGVPFVGKAGQLLTKIIESGMKLRRDQDVYICNVIKCRPPNNRDPLPEEKGACEPYLVRQLELIRPKVICALGGHAATTLLKTDESTGRLRGRWHFYHGIPLRVTYHPAYLLRSPGEKKKTWEDIQEVMKVLNGEYTPEPPVGDASTALSR